MFLSANHRQAINEGRADFVPIFLSETHWMFRRKVIKLDVALIQLSAPDAKGYCSLGTSVDCTRAAVQNAAYIIGKCFLDFMIPVPWKTFCALGRRRSSRGFESGCQVLENVKNW